MKDRTSHRGAAADIYKIHVKTRKVVRLTHQEFTPNTGAAPWAKDERTREPGKTTQPYPICNLGPCPLPAGKVMFTSNRNGFEMPRGNNMGFNIPFQLFVMDGDGSNVEMIGHFNIASALHPVILTDGASCSAPWKTRAFAPIWTGASAARTDYAVVDAVTQTPLLTTWQSCPRMTRAISNERLVLSGMTVVVKTRINSAAPGYMSPRPTRRSYLLFKSENARLAAS